MSLNRLFEALRLDPLPDSEEDMATRIDQILAAAPDAKTRRRLLARLFDAIEDIAYDFQIGTQPLGGG